jgi:excisionase family DNA binding protein
MTSEIASLLALLPDEAMVPIGWVRNRLAKADRQAGLADLSVPEVAHALGRAPSTVRAWCAAGEIEGAYKLRGREWRVTRAALRAWQDRQSKPVAAAEASKSPPRTGKLGDWRNAFPDGQQAT